MNEIQQLKNEVARLSREIQMLKQASTIPLETDSAFVGRGFVKTFPPDIPDPAGDYMTNIGFRTDISLSGEAETITVPSHPVRFLRLSDGSNLYLPLYAYAEFGF